MPFTVLIVEDEALFADQLEMLIDKLGYDHLGTVDNSKDALSLIERVVPDLILMDIGIEGEYDGIELSELIHQRWPVPIIFISSQDDRGTFARAKRVNAVNFLLKPFGEIQLQRSIEFSVSQLHRQNTENRASSDEHKQREWKEDFLHQGHMFIKDRQKLEKVAVEDILYLESDGHYCRVHLPDRKYLIRIKMSDLLSRLSGQFFVQSHRSFFVNIKKVDGVDLQDNTILLSSKRVPLSKRNREAFLSRLDYL